MSIIKAEVPDVVISKPNLFADECNFFMESLNLEVFDAAVGRKAKFLQNNYSNPERKY